MLQIRKGKLTMGKEKKHCFNCDELGHYASECQYRLWCKICGESGHCKAYCPDKKIFYAIKKEEEEKVDEDKDTNSIPVLLNKTITSAENKTLTSTENKTSTSGKLCYKCGKKGHLIKECTSVLADNDRITSGNKKKERIMQVSKLKGLFKGANFCFNCGQAGHKGRDCTHAMICKRCMQKGHTIRDCTSQWALVKVDTTFGLNRAVLAKMRRNSSILPGLGEKGLFVYQSSCFNCGVFGHTIHDCSNDPICMKCGEPGHNRINCLNPKIPHPKPIEVISLPKKGQLSRRLQQKNILAAKRSSKQQRASKLLAKARQQYAEVKPQRKGKRQFQMMQSQMTKFGQPQMNIGQPPMNFEPSMNQFGQPPMNFRPPLNNFGPNMNEFGQPSMNFGPSPMNEYGQPPMNFGPSPMNEYGQPPMNFGPSSMQPQKNFGPNMNEFGQPSMNFGPSPMDEFGQPPANFRPSPMNEYGQPPMTSFGQSGQSDFQMAPIIHNEISEDRIGRSGSGQHNQRQRAKPRVSTQIRVKALMRQKKRLQDKKKSKPNRPTRREIAQLNKKINSRVNALKKKDLKKSSAYHDFEGAGHQLEAALENIESRLDNSPRIKGFASFNVESRIDFSFGSRSDTRRSTKLGYENDDDFYDENPRRDYRHDDRYRESDRTGYGGRREKTSNRHDDRMYRDRSGSSDRRYNSRDRQYSISPDRNYHSISPDRNYHQTESISPDRNYRQIESNSPDRRYESRSRRRVYIDLDTSYEDKNDKLIPRRRSSDDRKGMYRNEGQSERMFTQTNRNNDSPHRNYDHFEYEEEKRSLRNEDGYSQSQNYRRQNSYSRNQVDRTGSSDFNHGQMDKEKPFDITDKSASDIDFWKKELSARHQNALHEVEQRRYNEALDKLQRKPQPCPLPGCEVKFKTLKDHVLAKHIPDIFRTVEKPDVNHEELTPVRISALNALKTAVLGPNGTLKELMDLINGIGIDASENENMKKSDVAMVAVCKEQDWPVPGSFTLTPMNSPAVLIHWKALMSLFGLIDVRRRDKIMSAFPPVGSKKIQDAIKQQRRKEANERKQLFRKTESNYDSMSGKTLARTSHPSSSLGKPPKESEPRSSTRILHDTRKSTSRQEEIRSRERGDDRYNRSSFETSPSQTKVSKRSWGSGVLSIEYGHGDDKHSDSAGSKRPEIYDSSNNSRNYGSQPDPPVMSQQVGLSSDLERFSARNNYSSDNLRQNLTNQSSDLEQFSARNNYSSDNLRPNLTNQQLSNFQQAAAIANAASRSFGSQMDNHTMNQFLTMLWATSNNQNSM